MGVRQKAYHHVDGIFIFVNENIFISNLMEISLASRKFATID